MGLRGFRLVDTKVLLHYYIIKHLFQIVEGVRSDTGGKKNLLKGLKVTQGKL